MKPLVFKGLMVFITFIALLCCSCDKGRQEVVTPDVEVTYEPPVILEPAPEDVNIVAVIENLSITRKELEKKFLDELNPHSFSKVKRPEDVNVQDLLLEIVAEKAMAIEGRKLGYLSDAGIERQMERFKENLLFNMVMDNYLKAHPIQISPEQLQDTLKRNPGMDVKDARAMLNREKISAKSDELYQQLISRHGLKKLNENITAAVTIYQRLLDNSTSPYSLKFVTRKQMQNDLTQDEKQLVLAVYKDGEVTLEQWFDVLHNYSPPSRPKDLNSPAGFERFMDQSILQKPLMIAEAYATGIDKDVKFLESVKDREDLLLTRKVMLEKRAGLDEPSAGEIVAYFNRHRQDFMSPPNVLKIEQIWCPNIKIASLIKKQLNEGTGFEQLRKRYSALEQAGPVEATRATEGLFFDKLWAQEPNDVIGPVRGFHRRGIGMRFVKILEKNVGERMQYSTQLDEDIKSKIYAELFEKRLARYRIELLKKYRYGIRPERFAYLVDFCRSLE